MPSASNGAARPVSVRPADQAALMCEALLQVMTAEQWLQVAAALERVHRQGWGEVAVTVAKGHPVHLRASVSSYLRPE